MMGSPQMGPALVRYPAYTDQSDLPCALESYGCESYIASEPQQDADEHTHT